MYRKVIESHRKSPPLYEIFEKSAICTYCTINFSINSIFVLKSSTFQKKLLRFPLKIKFMMTIVQNHEF